MPAESTAKRKLLTRRLSYLVLFAVVAALLGLSGYLIYALLFTIKLPVYSSTIRGLGAFFFGFMILLLGRYFAFMWFGFLDQMEDATEEDVAYFPQVTILVPAFNEGPVIEASIRSLLELDYPSYEVLIIDDGSTDDTFAKAQSLEGRYGGARVRVLHQRNGGKASALNLGVRAANSEFILCMDGDSKLTPDTLRAAVSRFVDPLVGAVAGNVKVVNRGNVLTQLQALEYIEGLNMVRRAQAFFRSVSIIPGPMGIFRRRVLLEAGGYATDTYAEDCDLTLKILERGWKIRYEPKAVSFTEAPEGLLCLIKQRYRWTRGVLQALRKRRSGFLSRRNQGLLVALTNLAFEAAVWPLVNVAAQLFLVYVSIAYGHGLLLVMWWLQLTVLDLVAALFCVVTEEEDLRLVPLAVLHRASFALVLDVCKLLAGVEELLRLDMNWGKLERAGRL